MLSIRISPPGVVGSAAFGGLPRPMGINDTDGKPPYLSCIVPKTGLLSHVMQNPSLLDYVLRELETARGTWRSIVDSTGVPMSTIDRIARGVTPNPGIRQIETLAQYFRAQGSSPRTPVREKTTPKSGSKARRGAA
jgi:hypothetical protein